MCQNRAIQHAVSSDRVPRIGFKWVQGNSRLDGQRSLQCRQLRLGMQQRTAGVRTNSSDRRLIL